LASLSDQLTDLYQATGGAVVLFSWIQFLREDALKHLDIHTLLKLPSDQSKTPQVNQDKQDSGLSVVDNDEPSYRVSSDPLVPSRDAAHGSDLTDLSSAAAKFDLNSFSESFLNSQRNVPSKANISSSVYRPTSSSNPLNPSVKEPHYLPIQPTDIPPNKDHSYSGLSLTPSQMLLSQILIHDAEQKQKMFASTLFDCGVCFTSWLGSECVQLYECSHIFCRACLSEFCKVQITEGDVRGITCPQLDCTATLTPAQVKGLVGEKMFSRYDRLLLQSTLDSMSDVTYCPRPPCGSVVILEKTSTLALCSVCSFAFCVNCKKTYHGTNKCSEITNETDEDLDQALPKSEEGVRALLEDYTSGSKQRRHLLELRYGRNVMLGPVEFCMSEKWIDGNTQACPHCFCKIQKDGGCDVICCTRCGRRFHWL
ncbi:hypothetical protein XENORESO_011314, partial [Xenotaenia resolanae]